MSQTYTVPYKGGAGADWSSLDDCSERDTKILQYLEKVTTTPKLEQELHLRYILTKNANTEYLQKHGMNGATDMKTFRKCMPVVDYEAFLSSVDRIANGDTSSSILSADPPVEVLVSSGTSGGDPKLYPVTAEDLGLRTHVWSFIAPTLNRVVPSLAKGKFLYLAFLREGSQTPGGLLTKTAVTSFIRSEAYKNRLFHPIYDLSSPDEVAESPDTDSAMYSHLLCGLLERYEIVRIGAVYASVIVKALRALETWWPDICEDIARGTLNKARVKDETVRNALLPLLLAKGADWRAELAESIRKDCVSEEGHFKQDGIIRRLWPNAQLIDTGGTGTMKAYLPSLSHYSSKMRITCTTMYAATEGYFGLNMNPSLPPEETFYVLIPTVAYYEFIPIGGSASIGGSTSLTDTGSPNADNANSEASPRADDDVDFDEPAAPSNEDHVLDLTSLKVGQEYQILVTTVSGYCRLKIGDVLKVVGSYNNSPVFEYMRRVHTLLCLDHIKTDEVELHAAVSTAALILEREVPGVRLLEYTSYVWNTDFMVPGHYVIVWELSSKSSIEENIPSSVLDQCCCALEASLNFIYREGRYEDFIHPLELHLVKSGTFDLMLEHASNRGSSISQYKVPRGLGPKHATLREIVTGRVNQSYSSSIKPPFTPSTYKCKQGETL